MTKGVLIMKERIFLLLLAGMLCIALSSCGQNQSPVASSPETATSEETAQKNGLKPEQTFPYKDDEGKTRYRLVINGQEVQTENLPFTYPDAPKGGYYPLEDVLADLGVECLCSGDKSALTTKINGKVLKVAAGVVEMTYGPKTVKGLGTEAPVCLNECLYVPGFLFMSIFDNGIVGFSGDRSAATLDTNIDINLADSGTAGLSVPHMGGGTAGDVSGGNGAGGSGGKVGRADCGTCSGSGRSICTYCGGSGSKIEFQQAYDPVSKQYKQTQKTVRCPRCGGSGKVSCPTCGGSGKR